VLAVADELVNLSVDDASGGITYDHVGYDGVMPYGTLTFGSAFSIVDTIIITVASGSSLDIDNIDVEAAVNAPLASA
jgi:hypothetical protein